MFAISNRAARFPLRDYRWLLRHLSGLTAYVSKFAAGIVEGQEMVRAARKRYPFLDW